VSANNTTVLRPPRLLCSGLQKDGPTSRAGC
jgi:hypothetical protein